MEASNSTGQVDLLSSGTPTATAAGIYSPRFGLAGIRQRENGVSSAEARKRTVEQSRREKSTT